MPTFSLDPNTLIQNLLGLQQESMNMAQQTQEQLGSAFQGVNTANEQALAAQQQALQLGAQAGQQEVQNLFQQAQFTENLQRQFNLDPESANNAIAKELALADQARAEYEGARAEYDSLAGEDFVTNPVGYIMAQLKMPAAAARVNQLADAEDNAIQRVNARTAALQGAKSAVVANLADETKAANELRAQEKVKLAEAQLYAAEAGTKAAKAQQTLQLYQVANGAMDDARGTIGSLSQIAARIEANADRDEARKDRELDRELRRHALQEKLDETKQKDEEKARMNARLATVSAALGRVEPMTVDRLRDMTNKEEQMHWLEVATTGRLGPDLWKSLGFYLNRGSEPGIVAGGGQSTLLGARQMAQAVAAFEPQAAILLRTKDAGKTPKPEEIKEAAFDLYTRSLVSSAGSTQHAEDLSSSTWDRVFTPYKAQFLALNSAVNQGDKNYAALENNLVKKTIDDLVKSGAVKTDNLDADQQQQVFGAVMEKIKTRQVDPKTAAAHVSQYMRAATKFNQDKFNYTNFALPAQDSYLFSLEGSFGDSNRIKVNLLDPAAVEHAMTRRIATEGIGLRKMFGWVVAPVQSAGNRMFGKKE